MTKRWLHQVLCSVVLAAVVISAWGQRGGRPSFLGKLAYPAYTFMFPVLRKIYADNSFERNCLLYSMSLFLAVILFLLIQIIDRLISPLGLSLPIVEGIISVAAYPLGWLVFSSSSPHSWLSLELVGAVALATMYFYKRWPLPKYLTVALLVAHFCLWLWATGSLGAILDALRMPAYSGKLTVIFNSLFLSVMGFASTILWANWVASNRIKSG